VIKGSLDKFLSQNMDSSREFKSVAVSLVVNNNASWALLDSAEWKSICFDHLKMDNFGSPAAKEKMRELNKEGWKNLGEKLTKLPWYSISEDEGTIIGDTKVLQNLHFCDPDNLKCHHVFLRYLDTINKEETTLVNHWKATFTKFSIDENKISGFSSDQALWYVPRGLGLNHAPCGTHMLDLSNESGHIWIKEEVDKEISVRQILTVKNNETVYFKEVTELLGLPTQSFPINSMVRFVTHEDAFVHVSKYSLAINSSLERLGKQHLLLKESEIDTIAAVCDVFKLVRSAMKMTQDEQSHIAHFLPIMYGVILGLDNLCKNERFAPSTGQLLFVKQARDDLVERITGSSQLNDAQRTMYIKAMYMDPYYKGLLDKIFPTLTSKTSFMSRCRKELETELQSLITKSRQITPITAITTSLPKNSPIDSSLHLLGYLQSSPQISSPTTTIVSKDPEFKWFQGYLNDNQAISSEESGKHFWLEKRKQWPSCFSLVCKYRSIMCTSIYEEQTFSTLNKIVTDDRSSLKDETIEEMLFFKKNRTWIWPKSDEK